MTRQEAIEDLQNRVYKNRFADLEELEQTIKTMDYDGEPIEAFDDVLSGIGYNVCDKCGALCDSEQDLLWIDGADFDEDAESDRALLKALEQEPYEYCAICYDCYDILVKKGKELK